MSHIPLPERLRPKTLDEVAGMLRYDGPRKTLEGTPVTVHPARFGTPREGMPSRTRSSGSPWILTGAVTVVIPP